MGLPSGLAGVVVCLRLIVLFVVALCARFASGVRWRPAVVAFACWVCASSGVRPRARRSGPVAAEDSKACCFSLPKGVFISTRFPGGAKVKSDVELLHGMSHVSRGLLASYNCLVE